MLNQHRQTVGVFRSYEVAKQAFDQPVFAGFPIAKTFLVGKFFPNGVDPTIDQAEADNQIVSRPHRGA